MVDPLAEVVTLLQPAARFSKHVVGAGAWQIRRSDAGQPFYCVVLEGGCRLALDGHETIVLQAGDFVLIPAAFGVAMSSLEPPAGLADSMPVALGQGLFRIGAQEGPTDLRILAGHCSFGSPDAALLVSLLPQFVHVRGEQRLATLVQLVSEETREQRPAREVVLARLLEVLLIEALRSTAGTTASPGLVRGLADVRLAAAIRAMHEEPTRAWTVVELAKEAALSRSAFFERFSRAVGVPPMEYLLAWRMALAKDLLRRKEGGVAEIAERVGYSSASTFSVAFSRHVGRPPTQYAREQAGV
jgi:AraC-like DNA-binding protein